MHNKKKRKNERRNKHHPDGRCISLTEMIHVMLRYPEVYSDLEFTSVSTMPLEMRCMKKIHTDS